jgi:hypothetical protein
MKQKYNAIIFFNPDMAILPRKYRNISQLENFLNFAQKSGGWYVNLYNAKDKKFEQRKYLKNDF